MFLIYAIYSTFLVLSFKVENGFSQSCLFCRICVKHNLSSIRALGDVDVGSGMPLEKDDGQPTEYLNRENATKRHVVSPARPEVNVLAVLPPVYRGVSLHQD